MFSIYLPAVSEAAEREALATQENIRERRRCCWWRSWSHCARRGANF